MRRLAALVFLICLSFTAGGNALAKNPPKSISYKGVTITPAIQNVDIPEGQPSVSFKITAENKSDQVASLNLSSLDFKSLNETGGLAFIGSTVIHKYGLANWLDLPKQPLKLLPGKAQTINVTVQNRADLAPGGHYAAILFSSGAIASQDKVDINQVVASLIFVKKIGGEVYGINLLQPDFATQWFSLPSTTNLVFKNTGNVQATPRGTIVIYDSRGRAVKRGQLNTDSGMVLPDSSRLYPTSLFKTAHAWLPGKYKVVISYRPDGVNLATTSESSFIYVNVPVLILAVILTGLIAVLARRIIAAKK